jgi:hypothetical protein
MGNNGSIRDGNKRYKRDYDYDQPGPDYSNCYNDGSIRDYNHNIFKRDYNGMISASNFREGAGRMGLGFIDADIAQSAFNIYDHNHNGYLDRNDCLGAYRYLHRLYS